MRSATSAGQLDRVNHLNIALMLLSAALASWLPFEVFLASYAVLGPLHYLTQISWLHDRGYFTTGRRDWIPLALLAALSLEAAYGGWLGWRGATFTAFGVGIAVAFVRQPALKLAVLGTCVLLAAPLLEWLPSRIFFGSLLATVVHVYVFTGLFILAGALKSQSRSAYASLAVHIACGAGLLLIQPATRYQPSAQVLANLGPFSGMLDAMRLMLPGGGELPGVVAIGRFLGFAYTYHYLNWFSKTGIIRWHEIPRARLVGIVGIWLASLALYAYDYLIGLAALYFLSILHVFLEFPLDARTFVDVVTARRAAPTTRSRSHARVAKAST